MQIAYGAIDPRKVNKPLTGHFDKAGVTPRRHVIELRTADAADYTLGQELGADTFEVGQVVDVTGTTKGKGFAGDMKRHGFKGVSPRTAPTATTASPVRSAGRPRPAASSRGCAWPAGWVACARPPRTSPSTPWTPRRACCSSRVPFPAPAARSSSCARPRRGRDHMTSLLDSVKVDLPAEIFDVQTNVPLIHQVVVGQLAAARQGTHSTKTRGEVRGGGRKPYKQKGTGRARQGSTRAPQFAGGGIVHGPQPRDYTQRTPKKMNAAALRGALSDRARDERLHVVETSGDRHAPAAKTAT